MNESEMQSTETTNADNTRTVSVCAEIWHVLLEVAGRQIERETAEVCSGWCQVLDPYRVIQTCQLSVIALAVAISLVLPELAYGSNWQLARYSGFCDSHPT
jgi:hypothetical protein